MKKFLRKLKKGVRLLWEMDLLRFITYNFLTQQIHRDRGCYILPYRGTHIQIARDAVMEVHARMVLNGNKTRGSKAECLILLRNGAKWVVNGYTFLYYGTTVQVHVNALLTTGETYMNTGSTLICADKITMKGLTSTARGVFIFDSDHHPIYNDGKQLPKSKEIIIEDHVWIGLKSTVLKGTHIGSDTVIGAHSLVSGEIPGGCMVAQAPARPVMKDIHWEH